MDKTIIQDYGKYLSKVNPEKGRRRAQEQEAKWAEERRKREEEKLTEAYQRELRERAEQAARERRKVEKATAAFNAEQAQKGTVSNTPDRRELRNRYNTRQNIAAHATGEMGVARPQDDIVAQMDSYINAGKLSKEQLKQAKELLKQEQKRSTDVIRQGNTDLMIPGTDEYNRYQKWTQLEAKTKNAGGRGALLPFLKAGNAVTKGIERVTNSQNSPIAKEINRQFDSAFRQDDLAAEQSPLAHGAGNLAGSAAMYSATSPMFDAAAEGLGVSSTLGKILVNQAAQNAQDVALDTLPEVQRMRDRGMSDDEIRRATAKNVLGNMAGNAVMQGLSDAVIPALRNAFDKTPRIDMDEFRQGIAKLQGINDNTLKEAAQTGNIRELNRLASQTIPSVRRGEVDIPQFKRLETASNTTDIVNSNTTKQIEDAVQRQTAEAQKVLKEAEPIEEWTRKQLSSTGRETAKDIKVLAQEAALRNKDESTYKAIDNLVKKSDDLDNAITSGADASEIRKIYSDVKKAYNTLNGKLKAVGDNSLETKKTTYFGKNSEFNVDDILKRKPADSDDFSELFDDTVPADNVKPTSVGDSAPRYREGTLEEAQGNAQWLKQLVNEEVAKYDNLSEAAQKNIGRVNDALDALDEAISRGASIDDIAPLNKEAERALGALHKNIPGDKNLRSWGSTYFGKNSESNVSNILKKGRIADDYPVDENGFMDVDAWNKMNPEEATELENMFNVMNEDTGIRNGFDIVDENAPDIRMDASTPDSMNANDQILPDVNVERLTREPNQLVDNTRERSFHASAAERGAIPDDIKEALRQQDSIDRNTYVQQKNWQTENEAIRLWEQVNTYDEAEAQYKQLLSEMNPAATPFARRLVSAYSKNGQREAAMAVMDALSEAGTRSGRFSQAMVLGLAKDDPYTALKYAEKELKRINEKGLEKFGKKWKNFELNDAEKDLFTKANPGDEAAIQNAFETIGTRIEREYPVKLREQLKEATHIGMLLNPRTMSRNVIANIPTLAMRAGSNRIEALGQRAAHLINKDVEVNQALLGGRIKDRRLAKEVYKKPEIQALFDALDGKYNEIDNISKHIGRKQMFKGNNPIDKFVDGMLGGYWRGDKGGLITLANSKLGAEGNRSSLEALRGATYKLLELGDSPFVKENFVARLASEIKTKGWKSADEITDDAIQRALKESLEATYKDPNKLSKLLLDIKHDTGLVGEGMIPFAQTLGSIGMRSFDYSPAGGIRALGQIAKGAVDKSPDAIANGIRRLSEGLTGSGMILGGIALYKSGLITGDYSDDPNIKEAQKRDGFKPYAIHIGDKYYTFDWMQPASIPGILGISIAQAVESGENEAEKIAKGALAAGDAWFNQSAFQSLAELLGGGNNSGYGEQSITKNFVDMVLGMPQRLLPSAMGATARTVDRSYRDTFDQTSWFNNYANQVKAKLPIVSETLPQSYDAWGQPRMRAESTAGAVFQQYLNPGEYSQEKPNELDQKIKAIYDEYPDKRLYPDKIPYSLSSGDFKMKLDNKQHSELSRVQGGYNSQLAEAMLDNESFNALSNESKADVADKVYSVARDLAYSKLYDKEPTNDTKKFIEVLKSNGKDGLINYLGADQELTAAGISKKSKAAQAALDAAIDGDATKAHNISEATKVITDAGLKPAAAMTYMEAQTKLPELTAKEFADAYVKADADGNGSLKQDEIIDAMNGDKKNAKKIQSMFWDSDKTLPVLVDGKYKKQSTGKGKSKKSAEPEDKAEWVRRLNSGEGDIDALIEQNGYKNHVADLYSAAKKRNPNITADEYISAFKAADTNGNGGVTQAEIKDLMKREPQNADRYYAMLWSDKWKRKLK